MRKPLDYLLLSYLLTYVVCLIVCILVRPGSQSYCIQKVVGLLGTFFLSLFSSCINFLLVGALVKMTCFSFTDFLSKHGFDLCSDL